MSRHDELSGRPLLSVIIPAFNREALIARAVDSVLAQDYAPVEVIVVDDGSTDETASVVLGYGDTVRFIRQENRGRAAARNVGIRASSGELVMFLDSDDEFLPGHADALVQELTRNQVQLAYTAAAFFNDRTGTLFDVLWAPPPRGDPFLRMARGNFMAVGSVFVRRSLLEQVGGFDEDADLTGHEDWELWSRCLRESPVSALRQVSVLVHFHSANTVDDPALMEKGIRCAAGKILNDPANQSRLTPYRRHILASMWASIAHGHLISGNTRTARARLLEGLRQDVAFMFQPVWAFALLKVLFGARLICQALKVRGNFRVLREVRLKGAARRPAHNPAVQRKAVGRPGLQLRDREK